MYAGPFAYGRASCKQVVARKPWHVARNTCASATFFACKMTCRKRMTSLLLCSPQSCHLYVCTTLQGLYSQPISPSFMYVAMLHVSVRIRRCCSCTDTSVTHATCPLLLGSSHKKPVAAVYHRKALFTYDASELEVDSSLDSPRIVSSHRRSKTARAERCTW
jgi:hypothetical protein